MVDPLNKVVSLISNSFKTYALPSKNLVYSSDYLFTALLRLINHIVRTKTLQESSMECQEIYQSWVDMPRQKNEQVGQDQTIAKLAAACEMSTLRGSRARQGSPCLTAGEDVNFNIYRISYYCFSYNRHSALLNIKLISFIYLSP